MFLAAGSLERYYLDDVDIESKMFINPKHMLSSTGATTWTRGNVHYIMKSNRS